MGDSQIQITQKGKTRFLADLILAETDFQDWVIQRAIPVDVFGIKVVLMQTTLIEISPKQSPIQTAKIFYSDMCTFSET